ncbi:isocitrate lyase, partial [Vibrio harveyi]
TDRFY